MNVFTAAYIEAALWSSTDDQGDPLDRDYNDDDLAPETLARMEADCREFYVAQGELLTSENCNNAAYGVDSYAGHDFWLTRNRHGAGFWDGGWREPAAEALSDAAHAYGECNLYVGDDGLIYIGI